MTAQSRTFATGLIVMKSCMFMAQTAPSGIATTLNNCRLQRNLQSITLFLFIAAKALSTLKCICSCNVRAPILHVILSGEKLAFLQPNLSKTSPLNIALPQHLRRSLSHSREMHPSKLLAAQEVAAPLFCLKQLLGAHNLQPT